MKNISIDEKAPNKESITTTEVIQSTQGWDKKEIPSHDASFNKPARLVRLCLKYRGLTSLEPLKKAIIQRLHGAEPTMCSRQEDGAFTLFFELYRPLALPQSQEGAEMVLNAWKNVHGLSKIAGAELDEAHFLSQLVCPRSGRSAGDHSPPDGRPHVCRASGRDACQGHHPLRLQDSAESHE